MNTSWLCIHSFPWKFWGNAPLLPHGNNTPTRQGCAWWPRTTAGKQKNLISGWSLFILFIYLLIWNLICKPRWPQVPRCPLTCPCPKCIRWRHLPAHPALSLDFIIITGRGASQSMSMKAKGQSHGVGPLLLPLSSNDCIQGPRAVQWVALPTELSCLVSVLFYFGFVFLVLLHL